VATIDDDDVESPASVSNFLHTSGPLPLPDVDGSNFEILTSGGGLEAGVYQYAVTAWQGTPSATTLGLPVTVDLLVVNGNEQAVSITLPELPAGADGFNIYRRFPGSIYFYRIAVLTGEQVDPFVDSEGEEVEARPTTPSGSSRCPTALGPPTVSVHAGPAADDAPDPARRRAAGQQGLHAGPPDADDAP